MDMTGPDFMCIGAPKAGTTWLRHICDHPEIFRMPIKEFRFFGDNPWTINAKEKRVRQIFAGRKTITETEKEWYLHWSKTKDETDEWYLNLFNIKGYKLAGDFTPSYCVCGPEKVQEIKNIVGDIPIVLCLRDPIERDWSQVKFTLHLQRKLNEVSIEAYIEFINSEFCHSRSNYIYNIDIWSNYFSRFHIIYLDDVKDKPQTVLEDFCDLLKIEYRPEFFSKNIFKPANTTTNLDSYIMPTQVYEALKNKHYQTVKTLAQRFGGPPSKWFKKHYKS